MGCASSGPAVQQASKQAVYNPHCTDAQPPALKKTLTDGSAGRRSSTSEGSNRVSFDANSSKNLQRSRRQSVEVSHRKIVEVFYKKAVAHEEIGFYFESMDLLRLKRKMEKLIVLAFSEGEGLVDDDFDMEKVHTKMIAEKGFKMQHWEIFIQMFDETMQDLQIPKSKVNNVLDYLYKTRPIFQKALDNNQR